MSWNEVKKAENTTIKDLAISQAKFWDSEGRTGNRDEVVGPRSSEEMRKYLDLLFKDINYRAMKILDYGCGIGRLYKALEEPKNYYGLDISHVLLSEFDVRYPNANKKLCNGVTIEYNDNVFDVITCYSVFTHIPKKQMSILLKEFYRVLNIDNGYVAVSIFDSSTTGEIYNWKTIAIDEFKAMIDKIGFNIVNLIEVPDIPYKVPQMLFLLKKR